MKKHTIKRIAAGIFFLALLVAFVLRAGYVLLPERRDFGATWSMYLQEPKDSVDLMFFGSSTAYCDVIPARIYEETGLTAYVMAGPEQTLSITYSYMKEAFRTQSPSVVFLEVTGLMFDRYMNFTKANVSFMPFFSANRLEATLRAAEPEERFGLLFPLYHYHDRWEALDRFFQPRLDAVPDPFAGATLMDGAVPQETRGEREYEISEEVFGDNLRYLQKIRELCAARDIRLVLFQAPSCAYIPAAWMERIRAGAGDTELVDFNERFEEMGLRPDTDFYDFLHCNAAGAVKFNAALTAWIAENCVFSPRPCDGALWQWRLERMAVRLRGIAV